MNCPKCGNPRKTVSLFSGIAECRKGHKWQTITDKKTIEHNRKLQKKFNDAIRNAMSGI